MMIKYKIYYKKKGIESNFILFGKTTEELKNKINEKLKELKLEVNKNSVYSIKIT